MGRLAKHADLARLQSVGQSLIAAGTMGVQDIARLAIALAHGLAYLVVCIGGAADEAADALVALAVEVVDSCEVRRVAHVHGIGQRLHAGLRLILARLQVFVEDVVGVVGSNEALHRQSHLVAEESGADVAEVA